MGCASARECHLWDVQESDRRSLNEMTRRVAVGAFVLAMFVAGLGASGARSGGTRGKVTVAGVTFAATSAHVRRECQETANTVGYTVPCPLMLPQGMKAFPQVHGCKLQIVTAAGGPNCAASWRGWIVGDGEVQRYGGPPLEHLALQGAPRIVANPARAIDGPGMFPGSRVHAAGAITVAHRRMHWYSVPPDKNQGSAFAGHLVLVWNSRGHTYAYGFHILATLAAARALDLEVVRNLRAVQPRKSS